MAHRLAMFGAVVALLALTLASGCAAPGGPAAEVAPPPGAPITVARRDEEAAKAVVLLHADDSCHRTEGLLALAVWGSKRHAARVIPMLKDRDTSVGLTAARALGYLGDRSALPKLKRHLAALHEYPLARVAFLSSIARLGDPEGQRGLLEMLSQPYPSFHCIRALAEVGDAAAIEPLVALLETQKRRELYESGYKGGYSKSWLIHWSLLCITQTSVRHITMSDCVERPRDVARFWREWLKENGHKLQGARGGYQPPAPAQREGFRIRSRIMPVTENPFVADCADVPEGATVTWSACTDGGEEVALGVTGPVLRADVPVANRFRLVATASRNGHVVARAERTTYPVLVESTDAWGRPIPMRWLVSDAPITYGLFAGPTAPLEEGHFRWTLDEGWQSRTSHCPFYVFESPAEGAPGTRQYWIRVWILHPDDELPQASPSPGEHAATRPPHIISMPPCFVAIGTQFEYRLVLSRELPGGVKYRLEAGPEGMELNNHGCLTWTPRAAQAGMHHVTAHVELPDGTVLWHGFDITAEPTEAGKTAPDAKGE